MKYSLFFSILMVLCVANIQAMQRPHQSPAETQLRRQVDECMRGGELFLTQARQLIAMTVPFERLKKLKIDKINLKVKIEQLVHSMQHGFAPVARELQPKCNQLLQRIQDAANRYIEPYILRLHGLPSVRLPQTLNGKAILQGQLPLVYGFSCVYNALKFACDVEAAICGINNPYTDMDAFKRKCRSFSSPRAIDPIDGVTHETELALANYHLSLQPVYHLFSQDNVIHVLDEDYLGIPQEADPDVKRMLKQNEQLLFDSIKDRLKQRTDAVFHFICSVKANNEWHAIYMGLVQKNNRRALYIFDNLNEQIHEGSLAKHYVDFLCDTFNISGRADFF